MCTCISMRTKDVYFGRTMDIDYSFGERVVVTPRGYGFRLKSGDSFESFYAFMGMAGVVDGYPLYAEAVNEKGLSAAGLNFPGNAYYEEPRPDRINLAPFELIPWALGNFSTVKELYKELVTVNLTNIPYSKEMPLSPLHWMISDGSQCLVVEQTQEGFHVYENPVGVLTNNPDFPFHQMHLNAYMNLSCQPAQNRFAQRLSLKAYGSGMGAMGLPGDSSPTSRFIRACFCAMNSRCGGDDDSSISQFFHILDDVSIVRGTSILDNDKCNMTTYSCCMNTSKGVYYYKTYNNNQLTAVRFTKENMNSDRLSIYELRDKQAVWFEN